MFKKLKKLLMVLLIVPAMFVFGACKNKNGDNPDDGGTPPVVTPPGQDDGGNTEPEGPGGETPTPSAENYVVEIDYNLPEGYEVLSDYSVTKEVGTNFEMPAIPDENLAEFFLGWYNKATDEKIETTEITGIAEQTIIVQAKWSETTLKNYYYTPGLTFEVAEDLVGETIVAVTGYTGEATKVIVPKFYETQTVLDCPVRMIAQNCFKDADVQSVSYSADGMIIGKNAFANAKITSFDFSNVIYIDESAFAGSKLAKVELDALTQGVNVSAFANCADLVEADFSKVSLFDSLSTSTFNGCANLTTVKLSTSLKTIGDSAFSGCAKLADLGFLQTVQTVGQYAFKDCVGVKTLTIYEGISNIDSTSFEGCSVDNLSVYSLFIRNSQSRFANVFGDLSSAKSVTLLGENIEEISEYYFANTLSLQSIVIANSVETIGQNAFAGCVNLAEITFPEVFDISTFNTNAIKDTAWYTGLSEVTYIGESLFYVPVSVSGAVVIKDGTKNIVAEAFRDRELITSVKIPASIDVISASLFNGCIALETVEFATGSAVKSIERMAFYNCSALTSINLDACELLTQIKEDAFNSVGDSIAEFKLPKNLVSIESSSFKAVNAQAFSIDASAANFAVEDGVLFNKAKTVLYAYPALKTGEVYNVPSTVETIKNYAFVGNKIINVVKLNSALEFENVDEISNVFDGSSQSIYVLTKDASTALRTSRNKVYLCYELQDGEFEYASESDVYSFTITATDLSVKYCYVSVEDKHFMLTLSVSGETITVSNVKDISEYFV